MALNILVGYTGLVSFGHGAWFGLGAYAAGAGRSASCFRGRSCCRWRRAGRRRAVARLRLPDPAPARRLLLAADLALSAMLYAVAFRWTEVTGGENGLGGIVRPVWSGCRSTIAAPSTRWWPSIARGAGRLPLALPPLAARARCWSRSARTSNARASSATPPTATSSLAFVVSAMITGLAGMLLLFNNRMTSADPISVRVLRRAAGDGDHRRHALVPRPGAGRAVLRDLPRLPVERHGGLAALLRPAVRRLHRVLADRARWGCTSR